MARIGRVGSSRIALCAAAAAAMAAPGSAGAESSFWGRATGPDPASRAYERHMREGDAAAILAAERYRNRHGPGIAEPVRLAIEAYVKAAALDPGAAEPHYRAAEVLYAHHVGDGQRPDPEQARRAIEHWNAFERLAPMDPRLESALFRRSITYTKLGGEDNYRKALADYEKQLLMTDDGSASASFIATLISNAAEVYMAVGELDEAITLYRRSIEVNERAVYGYGLALALERDGQAVKAREVMAAYVFHDRMRALHADGFFFIPHGDIHAYQALGYEVLGEPERAVAHYEEFLRAQPDGRYTDLARRRLEEVRKQPPAGPASGARPKPRATRAP